jgi:hypothetical protein
MTALPVLFASTCCYCATWRVGSMLNTK